MTRRRPRPGPPTARHRRHAPGRDTVGWSGALADGRGQSTVETVGLLPLLVVAALAIGHVLAAGVAHELAGHAAEAGAIAALRGADPEKAVIAALPDWSERRVAVRVVARRVRVRLEPPALLPGVADLLAATATADPGPGAGS